MQAGQLRHKITIQNKTETRDTTGQVVYSWADTKVVYAKIEPLSGREMEKAKQINFEIDHKITIRYTHNINTSQRVKFGNRVFEILSVINPNERNIQLDLMVKEQV